MQTDLFGNRIIPEAAPKMEPKKALPEKEAKDENVVIAREVVLRPYSTVRESATICWMWH